jgi:hypothetical protein
VEFRVITMNAGPMLIAASSQRQAEEIAVRDGHRIIPKVPTPYSLLLTYAEREAIGWIGNRYGHGVKLYRLLIDNTSKEDDNWYSKDDIEFKLPESVAWQISEIIEEDNLACFSDELRAKFYSFQQKIV